jgi:hypothetical protein
MRLTVTFLIPWVAPSDERTGLSFVCAAGPCQRSFSRALVPWDLRLILLSQMWDFPFRRLLRLAGSRWTYSTPSPRGWVSVLLNWTLVYNHFARTRRKHILSIVGKACLQRLLHSNGSYSIVAFIFVAAVMCLQKLMFARKVIFIFACYLTTHSVTNIRP